MVSGDRVLQGLIDHLLCLKEEEAAARMRRVECEERLVAEIECQELTSRKNHSTLHITSPRPSGEGFRRHKVVIKRGLSYKGDLEAIKQIADLYEKKAPVKRTVREEIDPKEYEQIYASHTPYSMALRKAVYTTPKKTSVTVVEVECD